MNKVRLKRRIFVAKCQQLKLGVDSDRTLYEDDSRNDSIISDESWVTICVSFQGGWEESYKRNGNWLEWGKRCGL